MNGWEGVQISRSVLGGEDTEYEGKYYGVSGAVCGPRPVQEKLPSWIGGQGPVMTPTFAAKYADGFNVPYVSPEEYKQRLDVVERVCGETRRDPAEVRRTVNLGFYMGADEKSADRNKEKALRHPEDQRPGMLVGTAQQVIDRMNEFVAAGAQGINIATRPPVDWDAWHAFIDTALPPFHPNQFAYAFNSALRHSATPRPSAPLRSLSVLPSPRFGEGNGG